MNEERDAIEWAIQIIITLYMFALLIAAIFILTKQGNEKDAIINGEHTEFMWEGVVVAVAEDGGTVYVMVEELGDDFVIEVDVYDRIIHTSIEIGDKAYFLVDNPDPSKWMDADLIAIEKTENEYLWEEK